ncbi:type I-G CRISPR-associated helicase/endonuclease Cas3g [Sorangium sp. So ce861]|uniref:type I-G CRISPR-associated helicase/endonuclease Cas3g n=1 Tax=Sorangium sp. So ce861 TaxID=3133323 RepID=UPI003F621615
MHFNTFFIKATGFGPYRWQQRVARDGLPEVLSIPTGLGKTEGVALAWAYRRLVAKAPATPRHLVVCLPMRALVRQTHDRLALAFAKLHAAGLPDVRVHALVGSTRREEQDAWVAHPERPWVLVGTQDQLLSRALNRGYTASPYDWPIHFGVLNNDCHWVLDEVQLMGPAVWTSAQLDWMRRLRFGTLLPCSTTWMSATVGTNFLDTRDRRDGGLRAPVPLELDAADAELPHSKLRLRARRPIMWFELSTPPAGARSKRSAKAKEPVHQGGRAAKKPVAPEAEAIADAALAAHTPGTLSLIVCNTVRSAQAIFRALPGNAPRVLLTSRFRAADRAAHEEALLRFEEARKEEPDRPVPGSPGLICVATQVIEAGIDVSARRLWSEIAPWASIIQRLGRLNRDGCDNHAARAVIFEAVRDPRHAEPVEKDRLGPYTADAIAISRQLLAELVPLSQRMPARDALAKIERGKLRPRVTEALAAPVAPLPRAVDVHGLFATEPDVHGGFTDVSPFVRDADPNADVQVFWRDFKSPPWRDATTGPTFDPREACAVSVHALRDFLSGVDAYVWDADSGQWQRKTAAALRPGMVVMLAGSAGGYHRDLGWTGERGDRLAELEPPGPGGRTYDDDHRSRRDAGRVTLDVHLRDAEREARTLVDGLGLASDPLGRAVVLAAREHDIGKAHPAWQGKLGKASTDMTLWAKYPVDGQFRPGMRHEAATALAMMARLLRGEADFPALSVYLAAAHHGKVRTHLRARTMDGEDVCGVPRDSGPLPIGAGQPLDFGCAADGAEGEFTDQGFLVASPGWTGIVSDLLGPHHPDRPWDTGSVPAGEPRDLGPFRLAYLEALVRIADWRASRMPSEIRDDR